MWDSKEVPNGVEFTHVSPDGDMGFPGNLTVKVKYTLVGSTLRLDYTSTSDKATVVNVTNHAYFNLNGDDNGTILDHKIEINADKYTPVNADLIPTGIAPVAGTPFDFRKPEVIGARINDDNQQLKFGRGYDHNWVLNGNAGTLRVAAIVTDPESGRKMTVETTEPGIQFYTGNFLDGTFTGRHGIKYGLRTGFCLETQHFPDSPNHPDFPSTVSASGRDAPLNHFVYVRRCQVIVKQQIKRGRASARPLFILIENSSYLLCRFDYRRHLQKLARRQCARHGARHQHSAFERVHAIQAHADRRATRTLRLHHQRAFALQFVAHIVLHHLAIPHGRHAKPLVQGMQCLAVEQRQVCAAIACKAVEAPLLVDDANLKQHASVAVFAGGGISLRDVKEALRLRAVGIGAEDDFPCECRRACQRMLGDDDGIAVTVKLNRFAVGRIDHRRMAEHFGWMAADPINAIEAPDCFLRGLSCRSCTGETIW